MKYQALEAVDLAFLQELVGEKRLKTGEAIDVDVTHDELKTVVGQPEAWVKVHHKDEVVAIMRYAHRRHIPVTVRGSGTGLVGACVPIHGGILLDMTAMDAIKSLDPINMTITVEAGVMLLDLAEYVEKEGFFYAPDPGEKTATIAGNIATNAGGMRAVKYGVTRDWVRALEVVTPTGELLKLGGKVVKNSTGYALKDLIIGSEGTLAVIVEATLRLMPKPKVMVSLLAPFSSRETAIEAAQHVITDGVMPTAVEYMEQATLAYSADFLGRKIPHNNHPAYLLISYDGNDETLVMRDADQASEKLVSSLKAVDVYLVDTEERKESVWSARGAFLEAIKASTPEIDECDVVLPRSEIGAYLRRVRALAEQFKTRLPYFGHVGDGNLHIYLCRDALDDTAWVRLRETLFSFLYDEAVTRGGFISGEHGIGYAKKTYMAKQLGDPMLALMKGIKDVFDPHGILNPGKVI